MKKIIFSALISITLFSGYAQPNSKRSEPRMSWEEKQAPKERIELFKIQFITEKLDLTTTEAEAFWPIYEAYKKVVKDIVKTKSEDEILLQEGILNARKKYKIDLKPVLKSDERVNDALKIEREFLNKMRFELNKRRGFKD